MTRKPTLYDLALWVALPMAHTTRIEGRLRMILDADRPRRVLTRRVLLVSLAATALGCGVLAALEPGRRAQAAGSPTPWKQTLASGAIVEVMGVSKPTLREGGWWRPDGSPLAGAPFGPPMYIAVAGRDRRLFAMRVTFPRNDRPWEYPSYVATYEVPGATSVKISYGMVSSYSRTMPGLDVVSAGADALPAPGTLRCGVAAGAWETLKTAGVSILPAGGRFTFHGTSGSVLFSRPSQARGSAVMTMSDTFSSREGVSQVVAVDVSGKTFAGDLYSQVGNGATRQSIIRFKGTPLSRIKEVRFQVLPYQWAEFRGIALKPGGSAAHR